MQVRMHFYMSEIPMVRFAGLGSSRYFGKYVKWEIMALRNPRRVMQGELGRLRFNKADSAG